MSFLLSQKVDRWPGCPLFLLISVTKVIFHWLLFKKKEISVGVLSKDTVSFPIERQKTNHLTCRLFCSEGSLFLFVAVSRSYYCITFSTGRFVIRILKIYSQRTCYPTYTYVTLDFFLYDTLVLRLVTCLELNVHFRVSFHRQNYVKNVWFVTPSLAMGWLSYFEKDRKMYVGFIWLTYVVCHVKDTNLTFNYYLTEF